MEFRKGPLIHPPFDAEVRALLEEIRARLEPVFPMTLEEWEDGFRRDQTPEREIAIWVHISKRFEVESLNAAEADAKMEAFKAILADYV